MSAYYFTCKIFKGSGRYIYCNSIARFYFPFNMSNFFKWIIKITFDCFSRQLIGYTAVILTVTYGNGRTKHKLCVSIKHNQTIPLTVHR